MPDEEITWITVNGTHIPIHEGQSKEDAIKVHFDKMQDIQNKLSKQDIAKSEVPQKKLDEMTVAEVKRNGGEREAKLMGNWQTNGKDVKIVARKIGASQMALYFVVGDREQQIDVDAQLRLEHAISNGLMTRIDK